jgi:hypothetical protein
MTDGYAHRVSAAALRSRGLVRVSGRGPNWRAELTDDGRLLLTQLANGAPQAANDQERPGGASTDKQPVAPQRSNAGSGRPADSLKTDQLVSEVIAAGGTLRVADDTARGGVNWRQRAYAAQRHGRVPAGKRLSVSRTDGGFEISLLAGETGNELGADAVPVPTQVRSYHPAVRNFRERTALHRVSRKTLPRALRIMQGLATELDRRGHRIACADIGAKDEGYGRYRRKEADNGQLVVTINGHELTLGLYEKGVGLRGPWEERKRRREEAHRTLRFDAWDVGRIEPYDKGATGELDLSILTYGPRQTRWGDRKRWSLEDRLPQVLRELETLAEEAEERRIAREREEAERQRAWEAAMAAAKERAIEHYHLETLRRRAGAWREADEIRIYCDAVEARHGEALNVDTEAARWLRFARQHADKLQRLPQMPTDPELKVEDLKPFLGGWSPYGPQRSRW